MKTIAPISAPVVNDTTTASSIKVCIHVLSEAHRTIRATRAATALAGAGFAVSLVDIEADRTKPAEENMEGIRIKHVRIPGWYTSRRFELWFLVRVLQAFVLSVFTLLRTRADVYHAGDLTALPACFIAAKLRRKPLIFEIYDLQFPVPETRVGFWRRMGGLLTRFHALVLPHCAGVIATSPLHAQAIDQWFHVPEVSLLRNIPPYRSVEKNDRLRQHLGLDPETRIALYQGNLQADRQLDRLITAAPYLEQNSVIVMMGKNIGGTQEQLEALIAQEAVGDRVKIIPPVPYEALLDWTASADIGLIIYSSAYSLNVQTCLPNKLFEFLMAGLPVLAAPLRAIEEVLTTYDVGQIVPSLTPADIGVAINAMLSDRDALTRMHGNALEAAKQDLNWEKESQQLTRLYHDILGRQKKKEKR